MKYLDKLRRMIQKIKNKYPRWDIFKIVKEAQRRINLKNKTNQQMI